MHPVKEWRNFKQRYQLSGAQCPACGSKTLVPGKPCACGSVIVNVRQILEQWRSASAESASVVVGK